jgi:serine O-acetyltransferase
LLAVFLMRMQLQCQELHLMSLAKLASALNSALTGAEFVVGCDIGPGLVIRHPQGIVVGAGTKVGARCTLLHGVTLGERYGDGRGSHGYPVVGDDVVLGVSAVALGDIRIGSGVTVGAMTLVLDDVPDNSTVVGIPARGAGSRPGGAS